MTLVTEWPDGVTAWHLNPWIVFASYCVSLVGSIMTLELLHRRSNGNHWRAWASRLACAVTMGLFAIWSMHYVGNIAIEMGDGSEDVQLLYSSGLTALSAFTPVIVILMSLWIADCGMYGKHSDKRWVKIPLVNFGSMFSGCSIVGMHYIGQYAVRNYEVYFIAKYLGAAFAIACGTCGGLFVTFFWFESSFGNTRKKRVGFAMIMAAAVTSMHFAASFGTAYKFKYAVPGASLWKNKNGVVAVVLACVGLIALSGLQIHHWHQQKQQRKKTKQVSLFVLWHDHTSRIMLDHQGQLPHRKITIDSNQTHFKDEFGIGHGVFLWLLKITHNWNAVRDLITPMRADRETNEELKPYSGPTFRNVGDHTEKSYSKFFRESFCIAADELANELRTDLNNLGTLYGGVMTTGSSNNTGDSRMMRMLGISDPPEISEIQNMEAGRIITDGGQALFLIKNIERVDMPRYSSLGFKFHSKETAAKTVRSFMKVPEDDMLNTLYDVQDYLKRGQDEKLHGTYMACFATHLDMGSRAWDVVVPVDNPYQIPTVKMTSTLLNDTQRRFVTELHGLSVKECIAKIKREKGSLDEEKEVFLSVFENKLRDMTELIKEPWFKTARLLSKSPMKVRRSGSFNRGADLVCDMIAFSWVIDIHYSTLRSGYLMYKPYKFLETMQVTRENAPNDVPFFREVRGEFGYLAEEYPPQESHGLMDRTVGRVSSITSGIVSPKSPSSPQSPQSPQSPKSLSERSSMTSFRALKHGKDSQDVMSSDDEENMMSTRSSRRNSSHRASLQRSRSNSDNHGTALSSRDTSPHKPTTRCSLNDSHNSSRAFGTPGYFESSSSSQTEMGTRVEQSHDSESHLLVPMEGDMHAFAQLPLNRCRETYLQCLARETKGMWARNP